MIEAGLFAKLLETCRLNGWSFALEYCEPTDCFGIEIRSAAPCEDLYLKDKLSLDYLVELVQEHAAKGEKTT